MNSCRLVTQHVQIVGALHKGDSAQVAPLHAGGRLQAKRELMPDRPGEIDALELQHNVVHAQRATLIFAAGDSPLYAMLDQRHTQRSSDKDATNVSEGS